MFWCYTCIITYEVSSFWVCWFLTTRCLKILLLKVILILNVCQGQPNSQTWKDIGQGTSLSSFTTIDYLDLEKKLKMWKRLWCTVEGWKRTNSDLDLCPTQIKQHKNSFFFFYNQHTFKNQWEPPLGETNTLLPFFQVWSNSIKRHWRYN